MSCASTTAPAPSPRSTSPPPAAVWALVTDLNLPARFSNEFLGAEWESDERGVGAVFRAATTTRRSASGRSRASSTPTTTALVRLVHLRPRQPRRPLAVRPRAARGGPACGSATRSGRARRVRRWRSPPTRARRPASCAAASTRSAPTCSAPSRASSSSPRPRRDPAGRHRRRAARARRRRVRPPGRTARRRLGVGARSSGPATPSPPRLPRRADLDDPAGHRHRPARRPHPGDARHVGPVAAGALRWPLPPRHRHQRPAGDGGLARRPRSTSRCAAPARRSRSSAPSPPASASTTTARSTSCRCPAAKAGHPLADAADAPSRSTWRRSARPTCA